MMRIQVSWDKAKYDKPHDVLHVFLGSCGMSFSEENYPGVFVKRCEDTDEVVGLTIMDFQKRKEEIYNVLPEYEFYL